MSLPSAKFAAIYDKLPTDVQNHIVEKQLIPLLDLVNKGKQRKVIASASKMKRRHDAIPTLDMKAKQREITGLLDELHRDAKRSFVKDRSHRTELLEQAVESVTSWLNDIWRIVYEHNVDFLLAHRCLLLVVTTLDQIGQGRTNCRCAFTGMYVPITLKRRSGKIVKSWHLNGAHNIEEVLQFIWRDLFLSMLATGTPRQIKKIPEMLEDIEDLLGWTALERLLYGGKKCPHDIDLDPDDFPIDTDSDLDEDSDAYTDDDSDLDFPIDRQDWMPPLSHKVSPSNAKHWSYRISSQMWQFRKHVHAAMMVVFKVNPSLRLYSALLASSTDPETTEGNIMDYLNQMATTCPEMFSAALDIYSLESDTPMISSLLQSHSHLIRPRDAPVYQSAVLTLANEPNYCQRATEIIEKELLQTASAVRSGLLGPFSLLSTPENKKEIEAIMKLRPAAQNRQDRIERWADAITTPGTNNPNPVALAAMVMGLPIVPALDGLDDADSLGYLDLDPSDPDMEDLRDELRPKLKQRFEGWTETAGAVKGGSVILIKVYKELMNTMPYLRSTDVVEELLNRLAEKPSRQYLIDAVDALSAFVKIQRRKIATAKPDKKNRDRTHATTQTPGPTSGTSSTSTAGPSTSTTTAGPYTPIPLQPLASFISRPETPPPPLEPTTPPSMFAWPMFGAGPSTSASTSSSTAAPNPSATLDRPETPPPPLEPATPPHSHAHIHAHPPPPAGHVHNPPPAGHVPIPAPLFSFYTGNLPAGGVQPGGPGGVPGGFMGFGFAGFNPYTYGGVEDVD